MEGGTRLLLEDALAKVRQGLTTVEEVLRVIRIEPSQQSGGQSVDAVGCPFSPHDGPAEAGRHRNRSAGYEPRSASTGSTRMARRAGTKQASSVVPSRMTATAASVIGSAGLT